MSILIRAKALLLSSTAACLIAVAALPLGTLTAAAEANNGWLSGCVGGRNSFTCFQRTGPAIDPYIRQIPQPESDADKERASTRDHKWIDRCNPTIVQDRYGVPRYRYTAAGCEFGVIDPQ